MSRNLAAVIQIQERKLLDVVNRERHLAKVIATLTTEYNELRREIEDRLDHQPQKIIVGVHTVNLSAVERRSIDADGLRAAHPKIAERFTRITEFLRLEVR